MNQQPFGYSVSNIWMATNNPGVYIEMNPATGGFGPIAWMTTNIPGDYQQWNIATGVVGPIMRFLQIQVMHGVCPLISAPVGVPPQQSVPVVHTPVNTAAGSFMTSQSAPVCVPPLQPIVYTPVNTAAGSFMTSQSAPVGVPHQQSVPVVHTLVNAAAGSFMTSQSVPQQQPLPVVHPQGNICAGGFIQNPSSSLKEEPLDVIFGKKLNFEGRPVERIRICNIGVASLLYPGNKCEDFPKAELKFFCLLFEMVDKRIDIMCISGHRWSGQGYFRYKYLSGSTEQIFYICHNNNSPDSYGGIAVIMSERLHQYYPNVFYSFGISSTAGRMIRLQFNGLDIIAINAPNRCTGSEKTEFTRGICSAVNECGESLILLGGFSDWNTNDDHPPCNLDRFFFDHSYHVCNRGIVMTEGDVIPICEAQIDIAKKQLINLMDGYTCTPFEYSLQDEHKCSLHTLLQNHRDHFNEVKAARDPFLFKIARLLKNMISLNK